MKKFFSLVLALAMALSMASFASAEETATIHIGVIGPMTGAAAVYGLAVARGAEIAVEEINAAGKVNIVLDVQDDENDAEKSINAYNATLDKGTQVILGCVTTTPCIAVSAQAYDERVFMLTPSASSLEVIANKDNMYQICFTDPAQGSASAEYIFNKKVGEKVAIIYNNADTYSTKESLVGLKVGAQKGTIQSQLIQSALPESELFELEKYPALALEVQNGNIAGLVVDQAVGEALVASSNGALEVSNFTFTAEEASFGKSVVIAKGNEDLVAVVNEVINKVTADGSYQKAYDEAVELAASLGL